MKSSIYLYERVINTIQEIIIVLDAERHIVLFNNYAKKMYSVLKKNVYGKTLEQAGIKMPIEDYKAVLKKVVSTQEEHHQDLVEDGKVLNISFVPIIVKAKAEYIVIIMKDLTEMNTLRQELKSKEKNYDILFETSSDAVFLEDFNGKILSANQKAVEMYGYSKEEFGEISVRDLVPKELHYHIERIFHNVKEKGNIVVETTNYKKDASTIEVEISANAVEFSGQNLILLFIRDITDKKRYRRQLQNYFEVMKNSLESIVMYDREGKIRFWNKASENLYGYQEQEVLGKSIFEVMIRTEDEAMMKQLMEHIFRGNTISNFEFCDFAKDGSVKYTLCTQTPMYDEKGEVYQVVSSQMDITRIKGSEKNLSILYYISNTLAEVHDIRELLLLALKETIRRLKYNSGAIYTVDQEDEVLDLIGTYSIFPEANIFSHVKKIDFGESISGKVAQTGQMMVIQDIEQYKYLLKEMKEQVNTYCKGIISIPLVSKDQVLGVMTIAREKIRHMTEQDRELLFNIGKQIGVALENALLLDALRQKTIDLQVQNAKVQEANRLKSEFLANMSHELRTPLNSIIGFSGIILDGLDGEINEEQRRDIERIYNSGSHLLRLINDVLDLSKIESNKVDINLENIDLYPLLLEVANTIEGIIIPKGIKMSLEVPDGLPRVLADETRLRQVLLNLFSNAAKFTEKGTITVSASLSDEDKYVQVAVKDTGVGIRKKDFPKIFEPFIQVDGSLTRKEGGTGLGMAISKQYMELMNGKIWFSSKYRKGSIFYIEIPVEKHLE